ncbi:phosphonate C-P lyase system protein PhnH [Methylobacterium sp. NEAU 140]|uniref:phosphonate C-P lyase system protein PhnH n=1 Tax=Methylobacterium sp. NEAU 140 TaxID=3064945 RepID=UPI002737146B|nr:phosphonate C-P lyase system protein PhnH [Methylobacterium sp. NEAU 140]MDP4021959.1 phosphonate C-P lyase system protein PhnH [Methylobacterium sp. NEAU 140]
MALRPGFADPVHDAQAVFRAALDALSRPARVRPLPTALAPPAPLSPELAALALALADADTPLWLDPPLAGSDDVAAFLRFHTGAPLTADPAEAAFALIADPARCPDFAAFARGAPDYPDRSATLILALRHLDDAAGPAFAGPGIRGRARIDAGPVPADWAGRLAENAAAFPLGIDLILTAPGRIAGLPRAARLLQPAEA